ncbi:MAG: pyridoxal-phosphate dependent enzyme [Bacillota bacterium]
MQAIPTIEAIKKARERIKPYVHFTPVFSSSAINRICKASVYFKAENMQKVGAFKARGAVNAVFSLDQKELKLGNGTYKGVITHSSGNHAAALAYAASCRGITAHVVMPTNAPPVKKAAVAGYGVEITFCPPTQKDREETMGEIMEKTGAIFVHPYDNPRVIAGQGTAAMELLEQIPEIDAVIAPVGGGGLLSGTALSVSGLKPSAKIYGAEPEKADDAYHSFHSGKIVPVENPQTIADGLRTSLGELTFPLIREHVSEILTVSETAIVEAMRLVWERMKLVIEPSAAVPLAALLTKRDLVEGEKIGLIVSGGNVDLDQLPWQGNK